jgi:formylglycine-generating enzyme required for sulfatase activity
MLRTLLVLVLFALTLPASAQVKDRFGVAVIIGNRDYRHPDVPKVDFAERDAQAVRRYVLDVLGYDEGNIIYLENATQQQMLATFGNDRSAEQRLWRLLDDRGRSDVFVYYSGHGVPGLGDDRNSYILPVDADPASVKVNGYPLQWLYDNLQRIGARSVTVVLDACFSGASEGGALYRDASVLVRPGTTAAPQAERLTVIAASGADEIASWDRRAQHGLFTNNFLDAVYGAADDRANGGNGDGTVTADEVMKFLDEEMRFAARRQFRREQQATLSGEAAGGRVLARFEGGRPPARPSVAAPVAQRPVVPPPAPATSVPQPAVAAPPAAPDTGAVAEAALGLSLEQRRQVQAWLEALGFDPRGIDGQFGPGTRGAIRSFQRSKSLSETGFLSAEVITALATDGPPALARVEEARRARDAAQAALAAARPAAPPAGASPQARPAVGVFPQAPAERPPGMRFRDCADCPEMVVIPAGTFTMGSPASEVGRDSDEGPQRSVTLASPLAVGRFHVTVAEYRAYVTATGGRGNDGWRTASYKGQGQGDRHPVVNVSWEDAQAYVQWLSQRTGRRYRLLTEAEWEYAARAGTTTSRWWGDSEAGQCAAGNGADLTAKDAEPSWTVASCRDGFLFTSPVGTFAPNRFGLHDMAGNARQWVEDCYADSYAGASSDASVAQTSRGCDRRVLRGGSWINIPRNLRSAFRFWITPGDRDSYVGFRVARTPGG